MTTKKELLDRAELLERGAQSMLEQAKLARKEASTLYEYPAEPPWTWSTIEVKLRGESQYRHYMAYHTMYEWRVHETEYGRGGTFDRWTDFVDWLRGDDVTDCGALRRLVPDHSELSLP